MSQVIDLQPGRDYRVIQRKVATPLGRSVALKRGNPSASRHRQSTTDPTGRVDILLSRLSERLLPREFHGLANELIREHVTSRPMTAVDLARAIGILPERRRHVRA